MLIAPTPNCDRRICRADRFRYAGAIWLNLIFLSGLGCFAAASAQEVLRVEEIPSPRANKEPIWCVDMTGRISAEAHDHINRLCEEVHQRSNKELCVVVVYKTKPEEVQAYGTRLFNHWGVGKWGFGGKFRNDGIMLIAALDDRRAAIVLGDGIDDQRKVITAQKIINDVVVPNFAAGDSGSALYEGIRACATGLLVIADLDSPTVLPSVARDGRTERIDVRQQQRRGWWPWMPWILGFTALSGLTSVFGLRHYLRYRRNYCEHCQDRPMVLLSEIEDDHFLDPPELLEEQLGSVDYDVWCCMNCKQVRKYRYGRWFTRYTKCPKCWYITVHRVEAIIQHATYRVGGKVRVIEECKSCSYKHTYYYRTPKKVRIESSGGGGGWSSGGGGGGSGFGGGSSSGGGASGGW